MTLLNPAAVIGHNHPVDPIDSALSHIQDLYDEALNFADGEPIADEAMHDTVTALRDAIHEAGKAADALRVEAKKPLDEQIAAIQDRFNPFIQPKKGKVDQAKASLGELLAAWRKAEADKKAAIAAAAREEAERAAKAAQDAMRASAGNLAAREEAEALLTEAKQAEKQAKRDDKAATVGLGLRTVWRCTMVDEAASLDWAYGRAPEQFKAMVQGMAEGVVRAGMRSVPGFKVWEEKVV
ncbi:hypothetical protein LB533_20470 [Mesorhizobium sp. BR1-1-13]|uniref:hypothetical protein n=1 Tax=Mesorhizobium sp. BR1-1-13 TaxID=2876656 RepID=UPI001CD17F6B|nr:hypothetical protein [Mesorhizobium sp. BR1-1-13]MBZ9943464.1 hypothetical protein [Mesorhizobium sp. BR1-1-13]